MAQMTFDKFLKKVGRYEQVALLEAVARQGAHQARLHARNDPHNYYDGVSGITPWALTEVAREAVVLNRREGRRPTATDVLRLCRHYMDLDDPMSKSPLASVDRFMVRTGFEQFRWNISEFEELSRSRALFEEAASQVPDTPLLTESAWRAATGYSVGEIVDVGFVLECLTAQAQGWLQLNRLLEPGYEPLLEAHPYEQLVGITDRLLAATPGELRRLDSTAVVQKDVKEHRFNPLTARPVVRLPGNRLLAPHPLLIFHRISPTGLYYDRCNEPGFTDQLGKVFEHYVGMHLGLIAHADVHRELDLGRLGKSVDFIVVLPGVTVLVEVKATRLTEQARVGLDQLDVDRKRTLDKAQDQIVRTHDLITTGHPAFSFVPDDRPVRGLIVTLEPYWLALSGFGPKLTGPVTSHVAWVRELEHFAAAAQNRDVSDLILGLPREHSNNVLGTAVGDNQERNPILDRNTFRVLERSGS